MTSCVWAQEWEGLTLRFTPNGLAEATPGGGTGGLWVHSSCLRARPATDDAPLALWQAGGL